MDSQAHEEGDEIVELEILAGAKCAFWRHPPWKTCHSASCWGIRREDACGGAESVFIQNVDHAFLALCTLYALADCRCTVTCGNG